MEKRIWNKVWFACIFLSLGIIVKTIHYELPDLLKKNGIGAKELSSFIETPYGVSTEDETLVIYGKPYYRLYVTDGYKIHYYSEEEEDNTISVTSDKSGISFSSPNIALYSRQGIKVYSYEIHNKNGEKDIVRVTPEWKTEKFLFNLDSWGDECTALLDYVTVYFQYEYWDANEKTYLHPFVSLKIYI